MVNAPTVALQSIGADTSAPIGRHLLGVVNFTDKSSEITIDKACPRVSVNLAETVGDGFAEVWTTARPVTTGQFGTISWASDGEFFFGAFHIPELPQYAEATEASYTEVLELTESLGYRPFRIWHYISGLNEPNAAGLETYRDFCLGRARVLERSGITHDMPAATVIGAHGGGIVCYLLARRRGAHVNLENPRQVPAYHYPARYGPKSPNFARATHLTAADGSTFLYVSGTASILGHRSMHPGDVAAQTRLALDNVGYVIGPGNLFAHDLNAGQGLADLTAVKVYVRHRADLPVVREICRATLPESADVVYLNADICRSDLLVELEGIAPQQLATSGSPQ
ncbi:chorismatase [Tamaricihabitans halophyticus]|uniref:Chorismatase n=1 Tax=Tamaricihabitans halophyticus TaxID=1262583 RepID=A0A4R2R1Z1_9PSEU|nr:chorismatase [Tamaricihabitans halophyticus]